MSFLPIVVFVAGVGACALTVNKPLSQGEIQTKPNLSGVWVDVSTEGAEETIQQDGKTVTLIHAAEGEDHRQVYRLDGTETRTTTRSHGQEILSVARARWERQKLLISESVIYPDGRRVETQKTYAVDAKGLLTLEMRDTVNGKVLPPVAVTYKRKLVN